jgi:hypothetical protein
MKCKTNIKYLKERLWRKTKLLSTGSCQLGLAGGRVGEGEGSGRSKVK